jgi:sucrose-6-phosphate hydrolase SacC (GH32 family)
MEEFRYQGSSEADLNRQLAEWSHRSQSFEMEMSLQLGTAQQLAWKLLKGDDDEVIVGVDSAKGELFVDRSRSAGAHFNKAFPSRTVAPLPVGTKTLNFHIFVDRSSVEVFAQDGAIAMTNLVFPKPASNGIWFSSTGGQLEKIQLSMWALRSAWRSR